MVDVNLCKIWAQTDSDIGWKNFMNNKMEGSVKMINFL